MATLTLTKHDHMLLKMRAIYDRPPIRDLPLPLCQRCKDWTVAKWTNCGWVNVARFATFAEASNHLISFRRVGWVGAIAHEDDGATLRCFEYRINRLRLAINWLAQYFPEFPEIRSVTDEWIDQEIMAAHLYAARKGHALTGRLHNGLMVFSFTEPAREGGE